MDWLTFTLIVLALITVGAIASGAVTAWKEVRLREAEFLLREPAGDDEPHGDVPNVTPFRPKP